MKRILSGFILLTASLCLYAATPSPDGARAYIISPSDGDSVKNPVRVIFGLQGMGVAPAGTQIANTGHHHLLVDLNEWPDVSMPLPASDNVRHFGGGQTETSLTLSPGKHTLQLLLADGGHTPHEPAVKSDQITIFVCE